MSEQLIVHCRPALLEDAPAIATLQQMFIGLPLSATQVQTRMRNSRNIENIYVASLADDVVAFASVRLVPSMAEDAPAAEVTELFVHPDARRRGIGRQLLQKLIDCARSAGATSVTVLTAAENQAAQQVYRRAGFLPFSIAMNKWLTAERPYAVVAETVPDADRAGATEPDQQATYVALLEHHWNLIDRLLQQATALSEACAWESAAAEGVRKRLVHILQTDRSWRIGMETGRQASQPELETLPTEQELQAAFRAEAQRWRELLAAFDPALLVQPARTADPTAITAPLQSGLVLHHVLLHAVAHGAEIAQLLAQAGASPGNLDLIAPGPEQIQ